MKFLVIMLLLPLIASADPSCAKEGEDWYPFLPAKGFKSCCSGLTATSRYRFSQKPKTCVPGVPGDSGYCVKCGDGKCSKELFEDKCSCPKDCK